MRASASSGSSPAGAAPGATPSAPGEAAGPAVAPAQPAVAAGAEVAAQPAIRATRVAVGYADHPVVSGIDLEVAGRTSLALVGTNGSGKSTLLRTLVGLLPVVGGSLEVLGTRPGRAPGRLAYASQAHASGFVLPLRAIEIVRMARFPNRGLVGRLTSEDHDLVAWAMRTMGIDGAAKEPLRSLSGGQQQRVYLAQVLARRADLIILDEPTSGLDAGGRERYLEAFAGELARGAAIVTATHDIAEAIEYDQVLLLARRVVALGPGAEVLTADRLLETFGILVRDPHEEHRGRFVIAERDHGGPQIVERPPEG
jgi:ABC-type Mn2+/Zn2+ transport system ATPase subunit